MANIAQDEQFLSLLPSKWWVKFFKKFGEIEDLPEEKWKPHHLLAHFSQRYQDHFGKRFSFSLKGAPSKCPEIYLIKQIIPTLGTDDPPTVKAYIDWVFDHKIIPQGRKIRSIGYLLNSQFCNEFWLHQKEKETVDRSTTLPSKYKEIVQELNLPIQTFGDLAFAKKVMDQTGQEEYRDLFNRLCMRGFEYRVLEDLR